jgi:hypothetical protein
VGSQPSYGKRELSHSSSIRRPSWYRMTLIDAKEHEEDPRGIDMERRLTKKFPYFRALMCSIIEFDTSNV